MKHIFALVLMLRVWGHFQAELDEYPEKFSGVVISPPYGVGPFVNIRMDDGRLVSVSFKMVEGSNWEEVDE